MGYTFCHEMCCTFSGSASPRDPAILSVFDIFWFSEFFQQIQESSFSISSGRPVNQLIDEET